MKRLTMVLFLGVMILAVAGAAWAVRSGSNCRAPIIFGF
jgi:hypothetical protein